MNIHSSALAGAEIVDPLARIRAFVKEHDVRWRRLPIGTVSEESEPLLVTIGFTVELHAAHVHPQHPPRPGCDECVALYDGLADLVRAAIPKAVIDTLFEVRPFRGELLFAQSRRGRDEVMLAIDVVHKSGVGPIDECERSCLEKLESSLPAFGAKRL